MPPIVTKEGYVVGKGRAFQTKVEAKYLEQAAIKNGAAPAQAFEAGMLLATQAERDDHRDQHAETSDAE